MAGNPAPDRDSLLSVFWDAWRDRSEEAEIRFGKSEDINSVAKMADRIIVAFQESEIAMPAGKIIGLEEQLRVAVIPGVSDVLARIDLIVEDEDAITVTDLKTARSRWSASQVEDSAEQLLLYGELCRELAPDKALRLEFAVITKAVKPVADRLPVTVEPRRIERTKRSAQIVWRAIERGIFFPAPSPFGSTAFTAETGRCFCRASFC